MGALALAVLVRGGRRRHRQLGQRPELVLAHCVGSADARVRRPALVALRPCSLVLTASPCWWPTAVVLGSRRQYDDGNIPSTRPSGPTRTRSSQRLGPAPHPAARPDWSAGASDCSSAALAFGSMTKSLLDAARGATSCCSGCSPWQGTDGVYTTMTQFLAAATTAYVVGSPCCVPTTTREAGLGRSGTGGCGVPVALAADVGCLRAAPVAVAVVPVRDWATVWAPVLPSATGEPPSGG